MKNYTIKEKIAIYQKAKEVYLEFDGFYSKERDVRIGLCYCVITAVKYLHNEELLIFDIWDDINWKELMVHKPEHITGAYQYWWPEDRRMERIHVLNMIIHELKKELENGRSITK